MSDKINHDSSVIDLTADRFERALKAGEAPRIEEYLTGAAGPARARLFEELLQVERELQAREGVLPRPDEYRRRFPDFLDVIDRNLAAPANSSATEVCADYEPTSVDDGAMRLWQSRLSRRRRLMTGGFACYTTTPMAGSGGSASRSTSSWAARWP